MMRLKLLLRFFVLFVLFAGCVYGIFRICYTYWDSQFRQGDLTEIVTSELVSINSDDDFIGLKTCSYKITGWCGTHESRCWETENIAMEYLKKAYLAIKYDHVLPDKLVGNPLVSDEKGFVEYLQKIILTLEEQQYPIYRHVGSDAISRRLGYLVDEQDLDVMLPAIIRKANTIVVEDCRGGNLPKGYLVQTGKGSYFGSRWETKTFIFASCPEKQEWIYNELEGSCRSKRF